MTEFDDPIQEVLRSVAEIIRSTPTRLDARSIVAGAARRPGERMALRHRLVSRPSALVEGRPSLKRSHALRVWSPSRMLAAAFALLVVAGTVAAILVSTTHGPTRHVTSPTTTPSTLAPPVRPGQSVPAADLVAVSFADNLHGAGLAQASVGATTTPLVPSSPRFETAVSVDGGRSWRAVGTPLPPDLGSPSIAWTSTTGGFVWDATTIVQISDGGKNWRTVPIPPGTAPAQITSVSPMGQGLWAAFSCGATASSCRSSLWSWSASGGWALLPISHELSNYYLVETRRLFTAGFVLAEARTAGQLGEPTGYLFEVHADGTAWLRHALPCGQLTGRDGSTGQQRFELTPYPNSIADSSTPIGPVVLECSSQSIMHLQPVSIWSILPVAPSGRWRLEADDLAVGGVVNPRVPADMGSLLAPLGASLAWTPTPSVLWMDSGQEGPLFSTDGGRTWVLVKGLAKPVLRVIPRLDFVNPEPGWCLFSEGGGLWATTDGGRSWTEIDSGGSGVHG